MLLFFGAALAAVSDQFSLVPPLRFTNLSEIGTWTIRGSAANMKRYFRLTSSVPNTFGGICQRTPTTFYDWTAELELSLRGGTGGDAVFFAYTRNLCPNISYPIQGFAIVLNTTETNSENLSNIYIHEPRGRTLLTSLPIRNRNLRLRVVRRAQHISLEYEGRTIAIHVAADASNYGYFSVYGVTTHNTDSNDLYALRTVPMSRYPEENNGTEVDVTNRKMLGKDVGARRLTKGVRRAKMAVTERALKEKDRNKGELSGEVQDLADALKIIAEGDKRTQEIVTIHALAKFVDGRIAETIEAAQKKVELAAERFDETRTDLTEVWSNLRSQLVALSIEAKVTMNDLGQQIIDAVKELKLSEPDVRRVERAIKRAEPAGSSWIAALLFAVSVVELVAYIVFFLWKRRKTHGFKKVD
jgi:mannose-binding lectin 1